MLERVGEQGRTGIALKPDRDEMEQTKARLQRMLWCVENRESHEAASHLMTDVERREEKKKTQQGLSCSVDRRGSAPLTPYSLAPGTQELLPTVAMLQFHHSSCSFLCSCTL